MTSSSNRSAGPCDAIVLIQDQQVGVIRLPDHRAEDFIAHFNRIYGKMGMALQSLPSAIHTDDSVQSKKIPASDEAGGDFVI